VVLRWRVVVILWRTARVYGLADGHVAVEQAVAKDESGYDAYEEFNGVGHGN